MTNYPICVTKKLHIIKDKKYIDSWVKWFEKKNIATWIKQAHGNYCHVWRETTPLEQKDLDAGRWEIVNGSFWEKGRRLTG